VAFVLGAKAVFLADFSESKARFFRAEVIYKYAGWIYIEMGLRAFTAAANDRD